MLLVFEIKLAGLSQFVGCCYPKWREKQGKAKAASLVIASLSDPKLSTTKQISTLIFVDRISEPEAGAPDTSILERSLL